MPAMVNLYVKDGKLNYRYNWAGWKVGDAADFLGMSADERQLLDARVAIARAIRLQRESVNMSQKALGERMKTSQPRVAILDQSDLRLAEQIQKGYEL